MYHSYVLSCRYISINNRKAKAEGVCINDHTEHTALPLTSFATRENSQLTGILCSGHGSYTSWPSGACTSATEEPTAQWAHIKEQSLDFHMFLASPDGEKALCPCCLPLGEVFWGALPVLVLRVALTHIVNRFLLGGGRMGGVWVGHSLEGLGATKGSSGETMQVTAAAIQHPHLTFPPPGARGDLVTFVTHFSVGNSHGSAKYHTQTASYIPSNISEDWTVNQWWFSSHR